MSITSRLSTAFALVRYFPKRREVIASTLVLLRPFIAINPQRFADYLLSDSGSAYLSGVLSFHMAAVVKQTGAHRLNSEIQYNLMLDDFFDSLAPGHGSKLRQRVNDLVDARELAVTNALTAGFRETEQTYERLQRSETPEEALPTLINWLVQD